ncbi:MAG: transposase [Chloroflexi bacterium]|nr:transposase [Chloroflexota bacterium]
MAVLARSASSDYRETTMTQWRPEFNPAYLYFITTKAIQYAPLFQREILRRMLVDYLDALRSRQQIELYAFVIMPNHLHLIVRCLPPYTLADVVRNYKSLIADRIVRHYQVEGNQQALDFLASQAAGSDKQHYKVWEAGYNAKEVFSADFLIQKMTYIHNNPCQPHWQLAIRPEDYLWSSARYYLLDQPAIIPLDNARELM